MPQTPFPGSIASRGFSHDVYRHETSRRAAQMHPDKTDAAIAVITCWGLFVVMDKTALTLPDPFLPHNRIRCLNPLSLCLVERQLGPSQCRSEERRVGND